MPPPPLAGLAGAVVMPLQEAHNAEKYNIDNLQYQAKLAFQPIIQSINLNNLLSYD